MIKAAITKIRAYEAQQREVALSGEDTEVEHLQTMIDHWRKILEELLK